jgi:hypothetical protein
VLLTDCEVAAVVKEGANKTIRTSRYQVIIETFL